MKVIDFNKNGNVIKLYFGEDSFHDYWGDDWNDVPYEHNAGRVYDDFISGSAEFAFTLNYCVLEPCNDWKCYGNSGYSKDNFKDRLVPCLLIIKLEEYLCTTDNFSDYVNVNDNSILKIYFNDNYETLKEKLIKFGAIILKES